MPFIIGDTCNFPEFGEVLPDGWLRVKTSGVSGCDERWDGSAMIGPDFEQYAAWKEIVENKEQIHLAQEEERRQVRAERRRFYRLVEGKADDEKE
jgi:hypothetical protein